MEAVENKTEDVHVDTAESKTKDIDALEVAEKLKQNSTKNKKAPKDAIQKQTTEERIDEYNDSVREAVLKNDLVPQLIKNEAQKRTFKTSLMNYVKNMIICQTILITIPIILMTASSFIKLPFLNVLTETNFEFFCSFLKYYISAIILEFIAMLFFIVKYVFDKSITDLVKDYKKDN